MAPLTDIGAERRRIPWRRVAVVACLLLLLVVDRPAMLAIVLLFLIVVPFEKLFPRHRQPIRRAGLATDIAYGVAQPVLRVAGLVVGVPIAILSLGWIPGLLLHPVVASMPLVARAVVGVVLFDFVAYWGHRWSHQVPFLWRIHVIHHSSERMDWLSGVRAHPFDGMVLAPAVVALLAAGFGPRFTGVLAVLQVVSGLFLHANVRWRLRPAQRIVATPEFHHWHHSSEGVARNVNFAAFLPAWDVLFGTAYLPRDRRPMVYGTQTPVANGFVGQLMQPLRGGRNPLPALRHPRAAARACRAALARGLGQIVDASRRPATAGRA
jgi:sterol desaturase/sphingolipid hydroxylase (fatty acid hydroxylase superfamily)